MAKKQHGLLALLAVVICLCMLAIPASAEEVAPANVQPEATLSASESDVQPMAELNGWVTNTNGTKSYYVDGQMIKSQVYEIDGNYYGFNSSGRMYTDAGFSIGNKYYRAKSDGVLYRNEWYKNGSLYYYYTSDCSEVRDRVETILKDDEVHNFAFSSYGYLLTDTYDRPTKVGGKYYHIDSEGRAYSLDDGWNYCGEDYYYLKDGELYKGTVKYIEKDMYLGKGGYYGFDYSGRMYKDKRFGLSMGENNYYYYAHENGKLAENELIEHSYYSTYYYGAEGKAVTESFYEVNGKQYYFDKYGCMLKNGTKVVNGVQYYFDEDGTPYPCTEGWNLINYNYYYYTDGAFLSNIVREINGTYYAFGYDSVMLDDTDSYVNGGYRRARSGGALYVNEWYYDGTDYYYYGEEGKAYQGLKEVDGVQYLFNSDGEMLTNLATTYDEKIIIVDADGVATEAVEGWNLVGGCYYYISGDEFYNNVVALIDGNYYGFDYVGKMYTDAFFTARIKDSESGEYHYFRAKSDGTLYTNAWYLDKSGDYYYYGADAVSATGLQEINGTLYYFSNNGGYMYVNRMIEVKDSGVTTYYYADENGYLTKINANGWTLAKGKCFYADPENGIYMDAIAEIDGAWYAFDFYGRMYDNINFYDTLKVIGGNGKTLSGNFVAKRGGALYRNEWYLGQYYFGDNCMRVENGLQNINGTYYYFRNTFYVRNELLDIDGGAYLFDKTGAGRRITGSEWIDFDGVWAYVDNGRIPSNEIVNINGVNYLFGSGGFMRRNGYVNVDGDGYISTAAGTLITTPGWHIVNGDYYYVQADGTTVEGWMQEGSTWYYFSPYMYHHTIFHDRENGVAYIASNSGATQQITGDGLYAFKSFAAGSPSIYYIKNGQFYTDGWALYNGEYYYFNNDGCAYTGGVYYMDGDGYLFDKSGVLQTNGWKVLDNNYYYVDANGIIKTGKQNINGNTYFFSDTNTLRTNTYVYEGNRIFVLDVSGAVVDTLNTNKSGLVVTDVGTYYVSNNGLLTNISFYCDNKCYFFGANGMAKTNTLYNGRYFGADGAAVVNQWVNVNGTWYYADDYGYFVNGVFNVDGVDYLFDGSGVLYSGVLVMGNQMYVSDANGVLLSSSAMPNEFVYFQGGVYYYVDGEPYNGWYGDYYFISGRMRVNEVVNVNGTYYYFQTNGKCAYNGFYVVYQSGNYKDYAYANANGALARNEWKYIGGYWYYFTDGCIMYSATIVRIDGQWCEFDSDGHFTGYVTIDENARDTYTGWVEFADGTWGYSYLGYDALDQTLLIDGTWYAFDYYFNMVTDGAWLDNRTNEVFYYGASGARLEATGWQYINGNYYYFAADHSLPVGWFNDGSADYYQDPYTGILTDSYLNAYGILYHFNASGACTGAVTGTGWIYASSVLVQDNYVDEDCWLYVVNGQLASGKTVIDGVEYYFYDGIMECDSIWNSKYYGADGVCVTTCGWYKFHDKYWIYIDENGYCAAAGIYIIDGTEYYFRGYYLY